MHRSKKISLFDYFVGASDHRGWHGEAKRLRCLEIDHQFDDVAWLQTCQ
jgi:hypothetical protein